MPESPCTMELGPDVFIKDRRLWKCGGKYGTVGRDERGVRPLEGRRQARDKGGEGKRMRALSNDKRALKAGCGGGETRGTCLPRKQKNRSQRAQERDAWGRHWARRTGAGSIKKKGKDPTWGEKAA